MKTTIAKCDYCSNIANKETGLCDQHEKTVSVVSLITRRAYRQMSQREQRALAHQKLGHLSARS